MALRNPTLFDLGNFPNCSQAAHITPVFGAKESFVPAADAAVGKSIEEEEACFTSSSVARRIERTCWQYASMSGGPAPTCASTRTPREATNVSHASLISSDMALMEEVTGAVDNTRLNFVDVSRTRSPL